jgi:hypothetical protein
MTQRRAFAAGASLWGLSMGLLAATPILGVTVAGKASLFNSQPGSIYPVITTFLFVTSFARMGALLVWRLSSNPIGWLLSAAGLIYAVATFTTLFGTNRWAHRAGSWLWGSGIDVGAAPDGGAALRGVIPSTTVPIGVGR